MAQGLIEAIGQRVGRICAQHQSFQANLGTTPAGRRRHRGFADSTLAGHEDDALHESAIYILLHP